MKYWPIFSILEIQMRRVASQYREDAKQSSGSAVPLGDLHEPDEHERSIFASRFHSFFA